MSQRQRILAVSDDFLAHFFRDGSGPARIEVQANGLPADARIVDVTMAFAQPGTVLFKLESQEFPEVPEGHLVPELPGIMIRRVDA